MKALKVRWKVENLESIDGYVINKKWGSLEERQLFVPKEEVALEKDEEGKLIWKCPSCGNTNQDTMNVARRTCGYIGTQFWNQGRTHEIQERVLHL